MELTLNVYKKNSKEIEKVYKTETLNLSWGVIEDILDALNLGEMKTGSNTELAGMVIKCSKQLKPFLMDLFDGLTADEVRNVRMDNLIELFRNLYKYATAELWEAADKSKN